MILDRFKLDNKVALVTGAGRGLGQGMAIALAEAGADVAGLDPAPWKKPLLVSALSDDVSCRSRSIYSKQMLKT